MTEGLISSLTPRHLRAIHVATMVGKNPNHLPVNNGDTRLQYRLHKPSITGLRIRISFPATLVLVWFLSFSFKGIFADFSVDDMMNLDYYAQLGFSQTLLATLQTFTPFYRPLGGVILFEFL
ncbi:MAG: hypothetical protein ACE5HM_08755 [Acidiferrobacterales bacterium]